MTPAALILACLVLTATGCAGLPKGFDRLVSFAVKDTETTSLSALYHPVKAANPGLSGVCPLPKGQAALAARSALAEMAGRSIDAQYYLIHEDLTGRFFLHELLKAADRGVRVRLLVDDMGLWNRTRGAAVLSAHPHVEVRIFNPFSRSGSRWTQMVYNFGTITRRMHNKAFIVDNQAAILGGRNIGNEYFEADPEIEFGDLDVLALGPVVNEVSVSFDKYWNSVLAYPAEVLARKIPGPGALEKRRQALSAYIEAQKDSDYFKAVASSEIASQIKNGSVPLFWGHARAVYDAPEKILSARDRTEFYLARQLKPYVDAVKEDLIIFSPYFVPGEKGVEFLTALCRRGVRVRVLTNSLASTDVGVVHAGYSRYRKALLRGGVELYELDKKISPQEKKAKKGSFGASRASLHTKSFVLDRKQVFIGSLNLDPRSSVENTEVGIIIDSEEAARSLAHWFDTHVQAIAFELELRINGNGPDQIRWHRSGGGRNTAYLRDPRTSFFKRLWVDLLKLLPIESQL